MVEKNWKKSIYLGKGILLAYITTLALVLVSSLLLTYSPIREEKTALLNTVVMIVSIAAGSIYLSGKVKEKGWINGGLLGILYYLILIMLNFLFLKTFELDGIFLAKLILASITGTIGGIIGINIS